MTQRRVRSRYPHALSGVHARRLPTERELTHIDFTRTPFADWQAHGWSLEVTCEGCGHVTLYQPVQLPERFGPDRTPGDVVARLACACKRRWPALVAIVPIWRA